MLNTEPTIERTAMTTIPEAAETNTDKILEEETNAEAEEEETTETEIATETATTGISKKDIDLAQRSFNMLLFKIINGSNFSCFQIK